MTQMSVSYLLGINDGEHRCVFRTYINFSLPSCQWCKKLVILMISEWWWMGKDLVGSGCGLIQGTMLAFVWRDSKTTKSLNQHSQSPEPKFEPGTSQIQSRSVNSSTKTFGLIPTRVLKINLDHPRQAGYRFDKYHTLCYIVIYQTRFCQSCILSRDIVTYSKLLKSAYYGKMFKNK
jgi:hypothetical protein